MEGRDEVEWVEKGESRIHDTSTSSLPDVRGRFAMAGETDRETVGRGIC